MAKPSIEELREKCLKADGEYAGATELWGLIFDANTTLIKRLQKAQRKAKQDYIDAMQAAADAEQA